MVTFITNPHLLRDGRDLIRQGLVNVITSGTCGAGGITFHVVAGAGGGGGATTFSSTTITGAEYLAATSTTTGISNPWYDNLTALAFGHTGGTGLGAPTIILWSDVVSREIILSEEEYLNNKQYWDLARERGTRWRLRTEQERREAEARAIQRAVEEAERRERYRQRDARARELLLEFLNPEQRREFESGSYFHVRGGLTGKRYRIKCTDSYQHNIDELHPHREGRRAANLCGHCAADVPNYDHFLAQKVNLELNEEQFLRICNRSSVAA